MVSEKTGRILDNLMGAIRGGGDPAHIATSYHAAQTEHEAQGGDPKLFAEALRRRLAGLNDWSAYERGASEWPDRRAELLAEWQQGGTDSQALAAMLEKYTVIPTPEEIAEAEEAMPGTWTARTSSAPAAKPESWLGKILKLRLALAKGPAKT